MSAAERQKEIDPWRNPTAEMQAADLCFRGGRRAELSPTNLSRKRPSKRGYWNSKNVIRNSGFLRGMTLRRKE